MPENPQQPKKPKRNKSKKVDLSIKKRWQDIVKDVDKNEVPVEVLQQIIVQLVDGTNLSIDIKKLLDEGQDPGEIEALLDEKFRDLDDYIEKVDFFIDIDRVGNTIQPETDKLLKNL